MFEVGFDEQKQFNVEFEDDNEFEAGFDETMILSAGGTAIKVDPTLSVARYAADAKVVGDKLAEKVDVKSTVVYYDDGEEEEEFDDYVIFSDFLYEINKLKGDITETGEQISELIDMPAVSDRYSATKTYKAGDYCIYDGSLWKCKTQCVGVTPEAGNTWSKTTIMNELPRVVYGTFTTIENPHFRVLEDYRSYIYRVGNILHIHFLIACDQASTDYIPIARIEKNMKYTAIMCNALSSIWNGLQIQIDGNIVSAYFGTDNATYLLDAQVIIQ